MMRRLTVCALLLCALALGAAPPVGLPRLPRRHHGGRRGLSAARQPSPAEVAEEAITVYLLLHGRVRIRTARPNFNGSWGYPTR